MLCPKQTVMADDLVTLIKMCILEGKMWNEKRENDYFALKSEEIFLIQLVTS